MQSAWSLSYACYMSFTRDIQVEYTCGVRDCKILICFFRFINCLFKLKFLLLGPQNEGAVWRRWSNMYSLFSWCWTYGCFYWAYRNPGAITLWRGSWYLSNGKANALSPSSNGSKGGTVPVYASSHLRLFTKFLPWWNISGGIIAYQYLPRPAWRNTGCLDQLIYLPYWST